jgi:methyl-accepting chemotaxis protein
MKIYTNLTIAAKLYTAFAVVLLLTLILATFSILRVTSIDGALKEADAVRNGQLEPLYEAREALDQTGISARNAYIFKDEADARKELDLVDTQKALYLDALSRLDRDAELKTDPQFAKVRSGLLAMAKELERPRKYREAGDLEHYGTFLVDECSPLRRQIVADIGVLLHSVQSQSNKGGVAATRQANDAIVWISTLGALSAVLCIAIGTLVVKGLLKQLGGEPAYATEVARAIARGELNKTVDVTNANQSSLLYAISAMRDNLSSIVSRVRTSTDAIASASTEIASGNLELSSRTETQASSLAGIAASMKKLIGSVRSNSEYVGKASELAHAASQVSTRGDAAVEGIVVTMNTISESSRKIVDIISVIDGIAFQTNILALNAAVEAARAGEQGRGFAVVATEVRNLAHRSAAAAKEVKLLIDDSVAKVGAGTELVGQAGDTIREVVQGVRKMTDIMADISTATRAQSTDIESVDQAIVQLDNMTLQNAALVEEAAAAAQSLQQQAGELAETVKVFQLDDRQQPALAPQARALPSAKPTLRYARG